jgi:hypothetical protein
VHLTTVTDTEGYYSFVGLWPGMYTITVDEPLGFHPGPLYALEHTVSLLSGDVVTGLDFGDFSKADICVHKYIDWNSNMVQDEGEEDAAGVMFDLYDEDGNPIMSSVTDSSGTTYFVELWPGTYTVEERLPDNWLATTPTSVTTTLISDQVVFLEFGNLPGDMDLVVEDIWSTTAPVEPGEVENVSIRIKNNGSATVMDPYMVELSIDGASVLFTSGPTHLWPGESRAMLFEIPWPLECANHEVLAVVDSTDTISESNETNNQRSETWATSCPDLVVEDIWSTTAPLEDGEVENVSIRIKNNGVATVMDPYTVELSIDGAPVLVTSGPTPLGPGLSSEMSFEIPWPSGCANHEVQAVADSTDTISESNETNNQRSETWATWCPD